MSCIPFDCNKHAVFDMYVTPEFADLILATANGANRGLSKNTYTKYATDMSAGTWYDNEQSRGISFYSDGNISDGQHRLKAISTSGIARMMKIETGLSRSHSYGIDAHRMRKTYDQIKIADPDSIVDFRQIALIKLLWKRQFSATPTPQQITEACATHCDRLAFVRRSVTSSVKFVTSAPIQAAIACAYGHVPEDRLVEFCKVIVTGMAESMDDCAAIRLREKLMNDGRTMKGGEAGRATAEKLTSRAIKAFCDKERIAKLYEPQKSIYPNFLGV